MSTDHADVLILGGGVAGLAAADVLSAHGKSVLLLEARNRLGGRIDTRRDPAWPLPIERGAEFLHGKPRETWDIIHASGISGCGEGGGGCVYDISDEHWVYQHGHLTKPDNFFDEVEKVLAAVTRQWGGKKPKRRDAAFEDFLHSTGKRFTPDARRWAKLFVEGFNAADAREVSCAWLALAQKASDEIEGDRLFRLYGGYDRIVQFLHTGLGKSTRVELSTVAHRITWPGLDPITLEAHCNQSTTPQPRIYTADQLILTVPLGVLKALPGSPGSITFDPPLPQEKHAAIDLLRMGTVLKVIIRFHEPFWEKQIPELDFMHGGDPFPTWWTTLPFRTSILTAWAGGPAADALSGKSENTILAAAFGSLSKLLSIPRRTIEKQLAEAHVCDWRTDPFARGAYSYTAAGGIDAANQLARPIAHRLFFAGEATHTGLSGTVAGALSSGRRAARQILKNS